MYTQCSKCQTVFKLSADVLRVAGGQVRCGNCGEVFNALASLAEDSTAFTPGESPLELESRADSILETVVPAQTDPAAPTDNEEFAGPGVEIARLEVLDWSEDDQAPSQNGDTPDSDDDRSLEFTLPPGELDRIFVESKKSAPPPMPQPMPPLAPQPTLLVVPESEVEPPPHPESALESAPPARNRVSGFEVSEDVRRDMLEGFEQHIQHARAAPPSSAPRNAQRRPFILWLSAAIVSALLLLAQVVHQNREWFVVHSPAPASLSAYQLRQWGVTGDPDANGTLRLRASILNTAAQLQPYPLLRVTLADRFGKSIGRRDFEPSEYMGKPTARLLAPGERADATLEILDPGKGAEGFEVDVCLRGVDKRVACANDVATQTKP